jgi:hypothetical protein
MSMPTASSSRRPATSALVVLAALLGVAPGPASAQEPVKGFDQLNTRLKPGDTVYVTDIEGREIVGKVRDLSTASLLVDTGGVPRDFQAARVRTIRMRVSDPLGNGVLWGMVAGFVGGALSCAVNPQCAGDDGGGGITAVLALMGAAGGAGIGAGVDAAVKRPMLTVYAAPAGPGGGRVSVAPMITPRAKGVAVLLRF